MLRFLTGGSPTADHGLQGTLRASGIVVQGPGQVGSSRTRDRIRVPHLGRWSLSHRTTGEVPISFSLYKNPPVLQGGIGGPERLSNRPQVTQQKGAWRRDLSQVQQTPNAVTQPSHSLSCCDLGARTLTGASSWDHKARGKVPTPLQFWLGAGDR